MLSVNKETKMAKVQKFPMQRFRSHPIQVNLNNLYPAQASITPRLEGSVEGVTNSPAPRHAPQLSQMMKYPTKQPSPDSSSSESSDDDTVQSSSDSESDVNSCSLSKSEKKKARLPLLKQKEKIFLSEQIKTQSLTL